MAHWVNRDHWQQMWTQLGCSPPSDRLDTKLIQHYSEPHRYYHTLHHLADCFAHWEPVRSLSVRPAEVEVALWFHDAIYNPQRQDNEWQSSEWAGQVLQAQGVSDAIIDRIQRLILATAHDAVPTNPDAQLLLDLDLAILGATPPQFDGYEAQIRQEYTWVPDATFCQARCTLLQGFLNRPTLYNTPTFQATLEAQARANLERSLLNHATDCKPP